MKIELQLAYRGKFKWTFKHRIYFIGYAFDHEGKLYRSAEDFSSETEIDIFIHQLKGAFAIIYADRQQVLAYTDTIASFPLFYRIKGDTIALSDTPNPEDKVIDFQNSDYTKIFCTQSDETLLKDWKSILAGQVLIVNHDTDEVRIERYFKHYSEEKHPSDKNTEDVFVQIVDNWARQMIQFADGRAIWIPLSGGYDSRLLLSTLVKNEAPNLHAYTYGLKKSKEVVNAYDVVKELKVDWHFIPYTKEAFQYFFTDIWTEYARYNHHYQSVPHEQDFFALLALKNQGLLKEEFVVVPGFSGDVPTGSYFKNFDMHPHTYIPEEYGVEAKGLVDYIAPWDAFQQWICENRLSKFIVNCVRLFEYFGAYWMLPMWHRDFLSLFYELELKDKYDQRFYIKSIFKYYFQPQNIDFLKHQLDTAHANMTFRELMKRALPDTLVKTIQKRTARSLVADPCNLTTLYDMLYRQMQEENLNLPEKDFNFNRLHAIYTLERLKNNFQ
ncbi:MAG: asparagine synthase-related protein [Chitinophagales bacterium]|nr:asparagine synthase-related protein [Chitinophagales bacterium]